MPWRRKWHPTPVLVPGKSHGQRSLVGYRPWGRDELDMTEQFKLLTVTCSRCSYAAVDSGASGNSGAFWNCMQNLQFVHFSVEGSLWSDSQSGGSRRRQEGLRQWGSLLVRDPAPLTASLFSSSWPECASERLFLAMAISFLTFPLTWFINSEFNWYMSLLINLLNKA